VALSGASTATTFTTTNTPALTQGVTKGIVRVKVYNGGSGTTAASVVVTVGDGTNTYIAANEPAATIPNLANSGLDYLLNCAVDITVNVVTITVALTVGTTTASMDIELIAGP